jgi:hypothetical protein
MFRFHKTYFILTIFLFFTEILIAVFVHDNFIRPYAGDFLVVILVYCFLRSFLRTSVLTTAMAALLFSYAVETMQYFDLVTMLGLQHSRLANIVIGNSFAWIDIVAYTLGIITVLAIEYVVNGMAKGNKNAGH